MRRWIGRVVSSNEESRSSIVQLLKPYKFDFVAPWHTVIPQSRLDVGQFVVFHTLRGKKVEARTTVVISEDIARNPELAEKAWRCAHQKCRQTCDDARELRFAWRDFRRAEGIRVNDRIAEITESSEADLVSESLAERARLRRGE